MPAAPDPALHGAVRRADLATRTTRATSQARGAVPEGRRRRGDRASSSERWSRRRERSQFERAARIRDQIARSSSVQSRQFVDSATARRHRRRSRWSATQGDSLRQRRDGPRRPPPRRPHVSSRSIAMGATTRRGRARRSSRSTTRSAGAADESSSTRRAGRPRRSPKCLTRAVGQHGRDRDAAVARRARACGSTMARDERDARAAQRLAQQATQEDRLDALREALELPQPPQRIECFDISHTMGEATVASCVVFDQRRRCRSPSTGASTSTASTPATTTRRCAQVLDAALRARQAGRGPLPDLLLIDGGKGQVAQALRRARRAGLHRRSARGRRREGRRAQAGLESLYLPEREAPLHLAAQTRRRCTCPADPRRGAPLRDHRASRAARKARTALAAGGDPRASAPSGGALLRHFGGLQGVTARGHRRPRAREGISAARSPSDLRAAPCRLRSA